MRNGAESRAPFLFAPGDAVQAAAPPQVEADTVPNGTIGQVLSVIPPGDMIQVRWEGNLITFANARWVNFVSREANRRPTAIQGMESRLMVLPPKGVEHLVCILATLQLRVLPPMFLWVLEFNPNGSLVIHPSKGTAAPMKLLCFLKIELWQMSLQQ